MEDKAKEQVLTNVRVEDMYQKLYDGRVTEEHIMMASVDGGVGSALHNDVCVATTGARLAAEVGVQTSLDDFFPPRTRVSTGAITGGR